MKIIVLLLTLAGSTQSFAGSFNPNAAGKYTLYMDQASGCPENGELSIYSGGVQFVGVDRDPRLNWNVSVNDEPENDRNAKGNSCYSGSEKGSVGQDQALQTSTCLYLVPPIYIKTKVSIEFEENSPAGSGRILHLYKSGVSSNWENRDCIYKQDEK